MLEKPKLGAATCKSIAVGQKVVGWFGNKGLPFLHCLGFRVILDFIYTSTFVLNLSNVHDVHKASSALNFTHVQVKYLCNIVMNGVK